MSRQPEGVSSQDHPLFEFHVSVTVRPATQNQAPLWQQKQQHMSGPAELPVLLGQSVMYFEQQMNAFAAGGRSNDTYGRMRIIARVFTPEEIRHLAAYYSP